jgi:signal peptidase II
LSTSKLRDTWGIRLLLPITAAMVLLADQSSKYIIVNSLQRYQEWAPIPALRRLFAITYTTNTGAAFGLFPNGSVFFVLIAVAVVIAILVYYQQLATHQWLLRLSLGLQLGGALGNLLDRLTRGYVVDFIYFKFWPVFNVADSCIVVGVALMAYVLLKEGKENPGEQEVSAAGGHEQENSEPNLSATP